MSQIVQLKEFTIRVYGIMHDEKKGILITDEYEQGKYFSKFPGGGLELGEGIKDCLIREWREELRQSIKVVEHVYTTDVFQSSIFDSQKQVISIYYRVESLDESGIKISDKPFDFVAPEKGAQSFRWIALKNFSADILTFPLDKIAAKTFLKDNED